MWRHGSLRSPLIELAEIEDASSFRQAQGADANRQKPCRPEILQESFNDIVTLKNKCVTHLNISH